MNNLRATKDTPMTTDEIISRCYEHGQPDYVLAADRLKELQAALAAAPPEEAQDRWKGFVLVPREPTPEMQRAGLHALDNHGVNHCDCDQNDVWAAMIAALTPPPSDPTPAQERREDQTAAFQNTDDADPYLVLAAVRHCASSWVGEARLLGNVRAKDIVRAIDALTPQKGEPGGQ